MKKWISTFGVVLVSMSALLAQNGAWCGTDQLLENNTTYKAQYEAAQQMIADGVAQQSYKGKKQGVVYTIPVVVHVIYDTYKDNISRPQIEDGIRVLNEDWRRMNADTVNTRNVFKPVAADMEIEFKLAKKDPNGNPTDGITRTQSPLSVDAGDNVKNLIKWDNKKYFNIWVVHSIADQGQQGTILGYAYFPVPNQNPNQDGMVIRNDRMGTFGTSQSLGRTISHEAGHYLALAHPFQGGCNGGDQVADTPPVFEANFGCNQSANSCHGDNPDLPDQIENHMDYADDDCVNMFTLGQKARSRAVLETSNLRQNLRLAGNLSATGVTNPPVGNLKALFRAENRVICKGETIQFTDLSEDGDPTSWNWTFQGGTPATSNAKNPVVTYNTPGLYDVTLAVTNSAGTSTKTHTKEIFVKDKGGNYHANWVEDFEGGALYEPAVNIIDEGDGIGFELTSTAASTGNQSLKLNNFASDVITELDAFHSPGISTNFSSSLSLNFDYAFARKASDNTDKLVVYVSTDCGVSWIPRRTYNSAQLATASITTAPFTPAGPQEWASESINFDPFISPDPILIKFEFENGGGNNLYLDNINFTGTIGLDELYSKGFALYPNPAKTIVTLLSNINSLNGSKITIADMAGKVVSESIINTNATTYDINLEAMNITKGLYTLSIENNGKRAVKKLVVE